VKRHSLIRLPFEFAILALAAAALAITPQAALAQHGGGGHGGGGGHFGGSGGGHASGFGGGGAHAAGYSGSHPAASPHPASHNFTPPPAHSTNAARFPTADSLPPGMIGALRNAGSPRPVLPGKGIAEFNSAPVHTTIGFPPAEGSATTFANVHAHSGPLSFSGQGHEIWQNSAPETPGVFSNLRSSSAVTRPLPPHIVRPLPPNGFQGQTPFYYPYGYGFSPFFGLGLGFGCDPFDSWGCFGFGYGYGFGPGYYGFGYPGFGYDNGYDSGYGYYDNSNSYPPPLDNSEPPSTNGLGLQSPDDSADINARGTWQNPPASDAGSQSNAVAAAPNSVLYLRDGTNFDVRDYWLAEGKLHYVTSYGGENSVDLGQVDIQRSVDANAARGLSFSLHPAQATPLTPPPSSDNPTQPSPNSAPQH
jgi:hypothetical protein